ncbi:hypothetical protein [Emergencia sp.]|uniref:hypothetical protein n=1 Tax=Emergencia sp. TaxID=1926557 RepID=UPI003AEF6415
MDKEVIKRAEAVICKMLDQLGTAEIGKPDYERKINVTCTAIHVAVEVINTSNANAGEHLCKDIMQAMRQLDQS